MNNLYDRAKGILLRLLRVDAEPRAPLGSPGSLRIFRAGRAYYRLKIALWGVRQAGIVIGFVVGAAVAHRFLPAVIPIRYDAHARHGVWHFPARTALAVVEPFVLFVALVQAPLTLAAIRLRYDLRCYMVTDRSLRIRDGLATLRESTLSFANVQQIRVDQGPLQRFLGLADVVVTSAGGGAPSGGRGGEEGRSRESFHAARFGDVENAEEIRDLILARLRLARDAGLGDPDDRRLHVATGLSTHAGGASAGDETGLLAAAQGALAECRALRAAMASGGEAQA